MAEDKSPKNRIYNTHDIDPVPKNLFKSFRHAKRILAKVAIEFFEDCDSSSDNLDRFEAFMKGTLRPIFVTELSNVGYFPDLSNGCYSVAVLVRDDDNDETKFGKWNAVLSHIQPATGDFFSRNLLRIYQDFYNEEERRQLEKDAEGEVKSSP